MICYGIVIWYDCSRDHLKNSIFKFDQVCLGVRVLSFHNFGILGGQLKTIGTLTPLVRNDIGIGTCIDNCIFKNCFICPPSGSTFTLTVL